MKLNISKNHVIFFLKKTNILIYDYNILESSVTQADIFKDLGIFLDSKLHFHNHANFVFSHCIKLLGLDRNITFNFSSLEYMYILYFTLVRSKFEFTSVACNSIASSLDKKLESIQQKFATLYCNRFLGSLSTWALLCLVSLRRSCSWLHDIFFCNRSYISALPEWLS
jgi:hypothetical protein